MILRFGLILMLVAFLASGSFAQNNAPEPQPPPAPATTEIPTPPPAIPVGKDAGSGQSPAPASPSGQAPYRVGGDVTPPKALYAPSPEYSEQARKARYQGTVVLWLIIDAEGKPQKIRVARALGMGLDEEAIKAVQQWQFEPSRLNGQAVPVQINVEVNFRLYDQLRPHPESAGEPPRFPGIDVARYPLVVHAKPVSFAGEGHSYTANHRATIDDAGRQQELTISCLAESPHCLPLDEGTYPARWQEDQKSLEILGLNSKGKWKAADYTVSAQ